MKLSQLCGVLLGMLVLCLVVVASFSSIDQPEQQPPYRPTFINIYPRYKPFNDGGDPGKPLFLTPLINDPKYSKEQVRGMALVSNISTFHGIKSYAGFLTVNPQYKSNMFFWYFPAVNGSEYVPTILWLQGGPGASSLFGLFTENGPLELIDDGKLKARNYSWHKLANIIYIDNPVGTGFSFTSDDAGYARNEKDVARDLHEAVQQLYELFEWDDRDGFWITGESYAGKYIPALALRIIESEKLANTTVKKIPLKGVAIGNGLSDPIHQLQYGDYLYNLGLIDEKGLKQFYEAEAKGIKCIKDHDMDCAFRVFDSLINGDLTRGSLYQNLTGMSYYYNYVQGKDDSFNNLGKLLQSTEVRRAIHVGNLTFHDLDTENKVEEHLIKDILASVAQWVSKILDTKTVCVYNGQLDVIVAYPLTRNYLNHLKFRDDSLYKEADRIIWRVDDEVAGYVKHGGNLIDIMVRNAGHMVPHDQPKWAFDLIKRLVSTQKFD